eukprot:scaffold406_cov391-Prasinococcus_capsulatus_cf.AAC.3
MHAQCCQGLYRVLTDWSVCTESVPEEVPSEAVSDSLTAGVFLLGFFLFILFMACVCCFLTPKDAHLYSAIVVEADMDKPLEEEDEAVLEEQAPQIVIPPSKRGSDEAEVQPAVEKKPSATTLNSTVSMSSAQPVLSCSTGLTSGRGKCACTGPTACTGCTRPRCGGSAGSLVGERRKGFLWPETLPHRTICPPTYHPRTVILTSEKSQGSPAGTWCSEASGGASTGPLLLVNVAWEPVTSVATPSISTGTFDASGGYDAESCKRTARHQVPSPKRRGPGHPPPLPPYIVRG